MKNVLFGVCLVVAAAWATLTIGRRRTERDADVWARETDGVA